MTSKSCPDCGSAIYKVFGTLSCTWCDEMVHSDEADYWCEVNKDKY